MRAQKCKGSRDLSPEEMTKFRLIEGIFADCCFKRGYEEVRTPTLEYLHLFTSTGTLTPNMLGKVYSFLDWDGWSGERVVLRPDSTIPIARLYIENMPEKERAKLFYITNIFIFEETGEKTREKWQCGAELIGEKSPLADVELLVMALETLKRLKLKDIELRLSHTGLIRALLAKLSLSPEEQTRIFNQILDGDTEALARIQPEQPDLGRALSALLELKGKSSGFLKNIKSLFTHDLPELESPLNNFISVVELLDSLGYDYRIDIAAGRGFEYYTGVIYQFFIGGENLGAGGRYDALIPLMGGRDIPASGFALYLDPLVKLVKPEALSKPQHQRILVRAEASEAEAIKASFSVANFLREAGYVVELHLSGHEPDTLMWKLDVQHRAPLFVLTDQVNHQRYETQTANEILTLLGEKSADKDSPA